MLDLLVNDLLNQATVCLSVNFFKRFDGERQRL
jgi:hypothetical protein